MKHAALCVFLCTPGTVAAETALPALHDVTGVAANDVLNLRQGPDAGSAIVGSLAPDQQGIEVVGLSPDGAWGQISQGEGTGWASMKFLAPQDRPDWFEMQGALACSGTEPFWGATLDPMQTNQVVFTSPDAPEMRLDINALWPGDRWRPVVGMAFEGAAAAGMVVARAESCSDGMSDRAYGLSVDLFLNRTQGDDSSALRGCCTLAP